MLSFKTNGVSFLIKNDDIMRQVIENMHFGYITLDGKFYAHDIIIRLNGNVEKRKKV
jgi:hypothetical protein